MFALETFFLCKRYAKIFENEKIYLYNYFLGFNMPLMCVGVAHQDRATVS